MLTNLLRYKDYYAHIAFDPSADAFHGRVIGIQDVIDFYGRTPEELCEECKNSVEDYLTWCAAEGTKPDDKHVEAPPAMLAIREQLEHLERLIVCA